MAGLEAARQALRLLRAHKARSLLTLFGLVWGTAAVILLVSWGEGVRVMLERGFFKAGKNMGEVWAGRISEDFTPAVDRRYLWYTIEDLEVLRRRARLPLLIGGETDEMLPTTYLQRALNVEVRGIEPEVWPADVFIPAALEDAIDRDNARDIRASLVVEAVNGPTTPEASEILNQRGVLVVPDILANAGGVTMSYFEWAQNIQQFRWEYERVTSELEKTIVKAYADVLAVAKEKSLDLRTAALVLGVRRVRSRRALREEIKLT